MAKKLITMCRGNFAMKREEIGRKLLSPWCKAKTTGAHSRYIHPGRCFTHNWIFRLVINLSVFQSRDNVVSPGAQGVGEHCGGRRTSHLLKSFLWFQRTLIFGQKNLIILGQMHLNIWSNVPGTSHWRATLAGLAWDPAWAEQPAIILCQKFLNLFFFCQQIPGYHLRWYDAILLDRT